MGTDKNLLRDKPLEPHKTHGDHKFVIQLLQIFNFQGGMGYAFRSIEKIYFGMI